MKPVIYIDVLFLVNFVINTLIFYISGYFRKYCPKISRLITCSLLSTIYGVLLFFSELSFLYTGAVKILFMFFLTWIYFNPRSIKELFISTLICLFVSALFCGGIWLITCYSGFSYSVLTVISKGIVYVDINPLFILAGIFIAVFFMFLFTSESKKKKTKDYCIHELNLELKGTKIPLKALTDTGCFLFDPTGNYPALIIEGDVIKNNFKENPFEKEENIIRLSYSTISKENEFLFGIISDSLTDKTGKLTYKRVIVAPGRDKLDASGRFNAIINPAALEINN